ncbi:MAG: hypothetical protein H7Y11_12180 [Armatimonadetes bacterium]|nr:hypothetical protein [Anaerolineae bacterium]
MIAMPAETWVDEITDFLISRPTPDQIIGFRVSDVLNQRLHALLDKNREAVLSPQERTELDRFLGLGHIFTML